MPEWIHLVPGGSFSGRDGRGPYKLRDAAAVIAASMADGRLPVDENHATDFAAESGAPSPARGWIVQLESRDDGIWGRVEWTESGRALLADKAYRGISPVFMHDEGGAVQKLLRAALTNTPNLPQLATLHERALHAAIDAEERKKLPASAFAVPGKRELPIHDAEHVRLAWDMLGRTQGLTSAERAEAKSRILARAKSLGVDTKGWDAHAERQEMDLTVARQALGLQADADEAAVLAAMRAGIEMAARQAAEIERLKKEQVAPEKVIALQTEIDKMKVERAKERAVLFIDMAIKAGKPIVAARDALIAQHIANADEAEKLVNALPSINAGGIVARQDAQDGDPVTELSATDMEVAKKMGLDAKALAEHKRKMRASADYGGLVQTNDGRVA